MKDYGQKLLSLLNICAENQNESEKLKWLANIIRSDDYAQLQRNTNFRIEYQENYSVEQLEKLDLPELKERKKHIADTSRMFRLLQEAIRFGNAPALRKEDAPDFHDMRTITNLSDRLTVSDRRENFTNIDEKNYMRIFDDKTIKSPKTCFDLLPLSLAQKAEITECDIQNALEGRVFCVDAEKLHAVHSSFLGFSVKAEETLRKEKLRRKKHRLFKIAVVMLLCLVFFACDQFKLFASADSTCVALLFCLSSVVFMIWG